MATAADFKAARELFAKLTFGQTAQLLNDALADDSQGIRFWMAGDHDPKSETAHEAKALLLSSEAAAICDVERQRINRWEREGRLKRAITNAGNVPLFWRVDVMRVKAEEDEKGGRRSRGTAAEPAEA
jgi:hypothetical protein